MFTVIAILGCLQAAPSDIDPIVARLGSEEPKVREEADRKVREIASRDPVSTRAYLTKRLSAEQDPEIISRIQAILRSDLALELVLKVEPGKVGAGVVLVGKIRNTSDVDQVMVRALDGSGDLRYPGCRVEAVGPDGKAVPPGHYMRDDKFCNPLKAENFVRLKPGEEAGFTGAEGGWPHTFLYHWKPDQPGTHHLTVTCDYGSDDLAKWKGSCIKVDKEVEALFARVPKVTLKATVAFEVVKE